MSSHSDQPRTDEPEVTLTGEDLIQAIRSNIAAEHEAIHRYLDQTASLEHTLAQRVLFDIMNEKRVHLGQLERLLEILTGEEHRSVAEGRERVDRLAAELAGEEEAEPVPKVEEAWQEAAESLDQLGI